LQSEIAQTLRDRKIANIAQLSPDVIAAGNIGCITQIASGTAIPVVHPVELIDWATGGPKPTGLSGGALAMQGEGDLVAAAKTSAPA
jgi:glycolate oxidase iron-sulfur subunit